jgi:hypothetical protein
MVKPSWPERAVAGSSTFEWKVKAQHRARPAREATGSLPLCVLPPPGHEQEEPSAQPHVLIEELERHLAGAKRITSEAAFLVEGEAVDHGQS